MIKAVLFDLDDTLFDHRCSMRKGLALLQQKYECFAAVSLDEFELNHVKIMYEVHLNSVLSGQMTLDEARSYRFCKMFEMYGRNADEELSYAAADFYRKAYVSVNRLVPGALNLLNEVSKKYKTGIITNNLVDEQLRKLKECGIEHLAAVMITSEETGVTKPHPDIFNALLNRLDASADESVMIGDYWNSDIAGAHSLGIKCIWINAYNEICPDPQMAVEVTSLEDTGHIMNIISSLD
jgi:HAD superfamily hydrolase (TIGR01509 family)